MKILIKKILKFFFKPLYNRYRNILEKINQNENDLKNNYENIFNKYLEMNHIQNITTQQLNDLKNNYENIFNKYLEMNHIQNITTQQLSNVQQKLEKLNKLDLDIFNEQPKTACDIGTFSQSGEDMIISFILDVLNIPLDEIKYLDLGANHARILSNTYHFYRRGIRGVLVEANPALIPELKFYRSEDNILNYCIDSKSGNFIDFYIMGNNVYDGDGLSTPDKDSAEVFIKENPNLEIKRIIKIETITYQDIIEKYLGKTPTILNIDIEGNEINILKSIDFDKYRPFIIIIEMIPYTNPYRLCEKNPEILKFMDNVDYYEYAFTGINSIFIDKKYLKEKDRIEV